MNLLKFDRLKFHNTVHYWKSSCLILILAKAGKKCWFVADLSSCRWSEKTDAVRDETYEPWWMGWVCLFAILCDLASKAFKMCGFRYWMDLHVLLEPCTNAIAILVPLLIPYMWLQYPVRIALYKMPRLSHVCVYACSVCTVHAIGIEKVEKRKFEWKNGA